MVTNSILREDGGEEDCIDDTKTLLIGENEVADGNICDGASELQMHRIHSIESTVVIRQLPSEGISFKLWLPATTLVTLLDNYRRDPSNSPLTRTLSNFTSNGSESSRLNIVELGSGTGIVGIAAAATLGANVTLTDLPNVIENLKFNYRRDPSNSPLTRTLSNFTSNGSESSRLNIVELGSGTGIVGIAAAATLGANVTLTDLPNVIENLKFNADANAEVVARAGGKVHVAPLRWGEAGDVEDLCGNVDLFLASDVVYHEHLYDPLLKTLRLMLLDKESERVFLMAHLKRWKKESIFFKRARKVFEVDVVHCDDPQEGSRIGVVVYRFAPKNHILKNGLSNVDK